MKKYVNRIYNEVVWVIIWFFCFVSCCSVSFTSYDPPTLYHHRFVYPTNLIFFLFFSFFFFFVSSYLHSKWWSSSVLSSPIVSFPKDSYACGISISWNKILSVKRITHLDFYSLQILDVLRSNKYFISVHSLSLFSFCTFINCIDWCIDVLAGTWIGRHDN